MRRREEVLAQDDRVGVVEDGALEGALEYRARRAHEVLLERIVGRDQKRESVAASAARPAGLLRERGRRAGVAQVQRGVERANIDAKLAEPEDTSPDPLLEEAKASAKKRIELPPHLRAVSDLLF